MIDRDAELIESGMQGSKDQYGNQVVGERPLRFTQAHSSSDDQCKLMRWVHISSLAGKPLIRSRRLLGPSGESPWPALGKAPLPHFLALLACLLLDQRRRHFAGRCYS